MSKGTLFWMMTAAVETFAAGCDDGGEGNAKGVVSCTVSNSAFGSTIAICEEVSGSQRQQLESTCRIPDSTAPDAMVTDHLTDGPCSRVGALGGCAFMRAGMTVTGWWYKTGGLGSPDDIKMLCAGIGGTFVAP